jgi:hypothetical protein
MTVQVIASKKGIEIGIAETTVNEYQEPLSTWSGRPVKELTNDELQLLWFKLDKYLDTQILTEIYVEMNMRGIPRIQCTNCRWPLVTDHDGTCSHCGILQ